MLKKHKWKLILSSAVILLPAVFGLVMWDRLPNLLATHFGAENAAGFDGRILMVVGLPLIMLAMHWLCLALAAKDFKGNAQSEKVITLSAWIIPVLSLFGNGTIYALALGKAQDMAQYGFLLFGLLFAVLGNYLPKCKQSFTVGIKIKWTLANEENWYATHRMAGKVWTVGGLAIMACTFLPLVPALYVAVSLMMLLCLIPVVYSYCYYKKQVDAGTAAAKATVTMSPGMKKARGVILAAIGLLMAGLMLFIFVFAGYEIRYDTVSFTVDATGWSDVTVNYGDIVSIEFRPSCPAGMRIYGFGDFPLQLGIYQNEEFGSYTRYAYSGTKAAVVVKVDGKVLVLAGKDADSTKAIYEQIHSRMQKG